jgi:hypothetical protein
MSISRTALLLAIAAAGAGAAEPVTQLLPPDTRILLGFSLRSVMDSPLIKGLAGQANSLKANITSSIPFAAFDPFKDLDDVVVATNGKGDNPPALLILRGRFHPDRTTGARLYHGVPIFEETRAGGGVLALLDEGAALAGQLPEVRAAIDRRGVVPTAPAIAARMTALAGQYDFWGVGDLPGGLRSSNPAAKDFNSIDRFEFGASTHAGLDVHGEFHVRSPEDAAKMEGLLRMLQAMMSAQKPSPDGTKFDLRVDHGTVTVSLFIPEEELKKGIAAQHGALAGMLQSGLKSTTVRAVPKAPPAPVVIVNNDRGETVSVTLPGGK